MRAASKNIRSQRILRLVGTVLAVAAVSACAEREDSIAQSAPAVAQVPQEEAAPPFDLAQVCTQGAIATRLAAVPGVTLGEIPNGPKIKGGVRYLPQDDKMPARCRVTGSYVTNPDTGKTANFLATLPANWNGKYLQLGCSGVCGYLLMNDAAAPPITITAQGYAGQLIEKGYATFGNDLGHVLDSPASNDMSWMNTPDGAIDEDALVDYLYRADDVMADMGKAFTRAFYAASGEQPAAISHSYYSGCSQGGRGALVAATRFPEKFDGIIAGSPAANVPGLMWRGPALGRLAQQSGVTKLSPEQVAMLNALIVGSCDARDGVQDGLIQNPAACDFHPTRDLPVCAGEQADSACVTRAQAELISANLSATTSESGELLHQGLPVMASQYGFIAPLPQDLPMDMHLKMVLGEEYKDSVLTSAGDAKAGAIDAFRVQVDGEAFQRYADLMRAGSIEPEDFDNFLRHSGKLLWYHNLSDELLTPLSSINMYREVAARSDGFAKLQQRMRFFTLPGTGHCGMGGNGPGNFDAMGALESWVEEGVAPNAIVARLLDPEFNNLLAGQFDPTAAPLRTMPLCAFPQMARYSGSGDINDAANWVCKAGDERMLEIGETGRQAGVIDSF